ncbi:MAG: 4-hydroxy-3-methylbut-2-enyl diphosphate reductase, partial [Phycisphaerae bacterium]
RRAEWFAGAKTVGVTAGASAPEVVVQECIRYLESNFQATISEETLREEHVHFQLPKELQELTAQ